MAMKINTCSEVVSLARELEQQGATFYQELARRWPELSEVFSGFAKENENYLTLVERAYYGVISDAYEGCFAFDMDPDAHRIDTDLPEGLSRSQAVARATAMEENLISFYREAAQQSRSLMADVPRAMEMVAKKRTERLRKLQGL